MLHTCAKSKQALPPAAGAEARAELSVALADVFEFIFSQIASILAFFAAIQTRQSTRNYRDHRLATRPQGATSNCRMPEHARGAFAPVLMCIFQGDLEQQEQGQESTQDEDGQQKVRKRHKPSSAVMSCFGS